MYGYTLTHIQSSKFIKHKISFLKKKKKIKKREREKEYMLHPTSHANRGNTPQSHSNKFMRNNLRVQ